MADIIASFYKINEVKMSRFVIITLIAIVLSSPSLATAKGTGSYSSGSGGNHSVRLYVRKNGKIVMPHHATNPNHTRIDNWSSKGRVNPYTGKAGTKNPY